MNQEQELNIILAIPNNNTANKKICAFNKKWNQNIKYRKPNRKNHNILKITDYKNILNAAKPKYKQALALLITTGIRISDCLNLEIDPNNVNNDCYIITEKKYGKQKLIYFMKEWFNWSEWVKPEFSEISFRREVSRINKVLNINFTFHTFRHSFVCNIYKLTKDTLLIMKILQHSKLDTTEIYLANANINEVEAYKKLEYFMNADIEQLNKDKKIEYLESKVLQLEALVKELRGN